MSLSNQTIEQPIAREHIGQRIGDKGVYVGIWKPKGGSGKKFNVFAAPEDLTDASGKKALLTFKDAAKEVGRLRNWHGHDGGNYANDTAFYKALKKGIYNGEWVIPPLDILGGKDIDGNTVQRDNLYAHRNAGAFKRTFTTRSSGSDHAHWYWSCTEGRDNPDTVLIVG